MAVGGVVLAAFVLRAWNLSLDSLWTDELGTYWVATAPTVADCVQRAAITQGQSAFYYLCERAVLVGWGAIVATAVDHVQWVTVSPDPSAFNYLLKRVVLSALSHNEFAVRLLSLLASTATTLLVCLIARRLFGGWLAPVVAGLVSALDPTMIYYAHEARPYAFGLMFCALSQLFFLGVTSRPKPRTLDCVLYAAFTSLAIYSHYVFASILLAQNVFWLYTQFRRSAWKSVSTLWWFGFQAAIAISLLPLAWHVRSMATGRANWNWAPDLSLLQASDLFLAMFQPDAALMFVGVVIVLKLVERARMADVIRANFDPLLSLCLWIAAPFVFAIVVSRILHVSLLDQRYMVLALIPYSLLLGRILSASRMRVIRYLLPGAYVFFQLTAVTIYTYSATGQFTDRIGHDWRGALQCVDRAIQPGDAIVTRFGDVRENWLPGGAGEIVRGYVQSPFKSFYWRRKDAFPIHNLTYTDEREFNPYYETMFDSLLKEQRIWVVGVNPPNTNYDIRRFADFAVKAVGLRKAIESDFSGVYVCLLVRNSVDGVEE